MLNISQVGGKIAGLAIVPSQFLGMSSLEAHRTIHRAIQSPHATIERIKRVTIKIAEGKWIQGILIYPRGWRERSAKCVVYHNPCTSTISGYLSRGFDSDTPPFQILRKTGCPLLMYDYRGTGVNRQTNERPCVKTICADGYAVLKFAMKHFNKVKVWGSSLGGGVATVACETYLAKKTNHVSRISLYNHDSFTSTGALVLPETMIGIAAFFGAHLDAETALRSLVKRGVKVVLLSHKNDPVIGEGARMADIAPELKGNVRLIQSNDSSHSSLSPEMLRQL